MVSRLGEYMQESGKLKEAVQYFEKALEKDELAEVFYQQLMVCYDKLGQQARAVRVYKRCNSILSESLGICPSEETETIYHNVSKKISLS
jgi:DNA-binding SARP family transcriptional activator